MRDDSLWDVEGLRLKTSRFVELLDGKTRECTMIGPDVWKELGTKRTERVSFRGILYLKRKDVIT